MHFKLLSDYGNDIHGKRYCKQCGKMKSFQSFISKNKLYICIICNTCRQIQEQRSRVERRAKERKRREVEFQKLSFMVKKKLEEPNTINLRSRMIGRKKDEDKTTTPPTTIPHAQWIVQNTHNMPKTEHPAFMAKLVYHPIQLHLQGYLKQYSLLYSIHEWI